MLLSYFRAVNKTPAFAGLFVSRESLVVDSVIGS